MNKHQTNSLEKVIERLSENKGNEEMMELVRQVMKNDHDGMLNNKEYWKRGNDKDKY